MTKAGRSIWLFITFLFAIGITALIFPVVLACHGHVIPGMGGDSGKNVFAYLYHILYDKGFWFSGMNYPYGEHIIFTDGQPLLSVTLGYFKHMTPASALAVMWGCILAGYVLAIVYVYKILVHFGVRPFVAMLFAGLIIILSPQLYRSLGHFGLSYACVVPMLFFWTIRYHQHAQWKYAAYILILGLLTTFLHPYYSAVTLLWVFFYVFCYFVFSVARFPGKVRHALPLIISVVLLFAVVGIIMKATDPIQDRPATPYGLTVYCARGEHILTSYYSPVWKYIEGNEGAIKDASGEEGFSYLGLIVIAAVVLALVMKIMDLRKKAANPAIAANYGFPPIWLFMALGALLFSMGVPFVWHMEWIVKYLSFLRQFRTLGRFIWIFYYIVTIYGVVVVYHYHTLYLAKGKRIIAYSILIFAIALWSFEASGYISYQHRAMAESENNYDILCGKKGNDWQQFLAAAHYRPTDFQAILMMRFFNVGTDKLWLGRDATDLEIAAGLVSGTQLHLPLIDACMARSSWSIAGKQVKIAAGPYADKPMLNELPDNKPFLLLNSASDDLDEDQKFIPGISDYIGTFNGWRAYACYPDRIKEACRKYTDSIHAMVPYLRTGDTCIRCSGTWYTDHFDLGKATEKFFGTGALPQAPDLEKVITIIPVKPAFADQPYEFSCWFLLGNEDYKSPFYKLDLLDDKGNVLRTENALTKESTDNHGLWFRCSVFFTIPAQCTAIRCRLRNEPDDTYKVMDELLLRPVGSLIISRSAKGSVMVNNHLVIP